MGRSFRWVGVGARVKQQGGLGARSGGSTILEQTGEVAVGR